MTAPINEGDLAFLQRMENLRLCFRSWIETEEFDTLIALARRGHDAVQAMTAIVASAGGTVVIDPGTLERLPRLSLEKTSDPESGGYTYRARPT